MTDRPPDDLDTDVIVVGAGPAGLTAAYHLTRKSTLRVVVLEANPRYVGGISRTESYKGFSFDIGGHRFFSKSAEIEALWREILPDDFLERERSSKILYGGKYYSYPLDGFEALRNLGVVRSVACVLSYLWARVTPVRAPRSFHDWVRNEFGERLYRIFFKTYTEKVWGIGCDELSADWAAQRIKGLNLGRAIFNALGRTFRRRGGPVAAGAPVIKTLIESFRYPRLGPGMMWDAARRHVLDRGGQVLMGTAAVGFEFDRVSGRWTVRTRSDGGERVLTARHVISSAAMRDVVCSVHPRPACADAAAKLGYRDFVTVALIVRARPGLPGENWIYVHEPGVRVGRIQNYRSWSPEMVPDAQRACLGLEYFCFEGDGLWSMSDDALVELAAGELSELGIVPASDVLDGKVVRQQKAYPVYDDHYRDIVEAIRAEFEANYPGMHFVGRNGMHKYNNQDHAMMTGLLAVENILVGERRYDLWQVNEDAEYLEAGAAGGAASVSGLRVTPARVAN